MHDAQYKNSHVHSTLAVASGSGLYTGHVIVWIALFVEGIISVGIVVRRGRGTVVAGVVAVVVQTMKVHVTT